MMPAPISRSRASLHAIGASARNHREVDACVWPCGYVMSVNSVLVSDFALRGATRVRAWVAMLASRSAVSSAA